MDHAKKIADHFWIIEENGAHMFLFEGTGGAMLLDTGLGTLPLREIVSELTSLPVFLVNTHVDKDHISGNSAFSPVNMHPAEMDHYQSALPEGCRMEDVRPLWEGEVIDLGHWRFEVILTPGHTAGSIMLLEREKRMLISGDTIQDEFIFLAGAGRSVPAFQSSLKRIIAMSGTFDTIWPSHGSYPLPADTIPGILQGSQDLLDGKLPAQEPPWPMPGKKYVCDAVSFIY